MKRLWRYLNVVLAVFLIWLVLRSVGLHELAEVLQNANPALIVLACVLGPTASLISAYKWHLLLRAQGVDTPLMVLFQLYLVGTFFNNFLPSSVGGDVIRISELGRTIKDPATAAASVFVERLSGFVVLIVIAGIAFFVRFLTLDSAPLRLFMLLAFGGILFVAWMAFDPRLLRWIERYARLPLVEKFVRKFAKFQAALHHYRRQPRVIVLALVWSLIFYIRLVLVVYLIVLAFVPDASFIDLFLVVPITNVVALMPFSINGIGLQEWSYVLLFPTIGLSASVGLSTMLIVWLVTLVSVLWGGLIYLRTRVRQPAEPAPLQP